MFIHCPYCHSDQVYPVFVSHPHGHRPEQSPVSLISQLGAGRILFKTLSGGLRLSPWVAGLAEVLLRAACAHLMETHRNDTGAGISTGYCCKICQRSFYGRQD
ncbi:hypothetical protein CDG60_14565 [Acinetobacter chinensis]|uniref:Uncharacterized protein n=1 Tax=Acinetobacter chinensis TaxID=2004650 RepID=A0A3B7LST3_9GAMM|nr:hypothetical protein [Acinetobacter chinensis]AXY55736.1 hypothetical protein CDG60_03485 [Acinetobacter chinensis]AXY57678.1 hypothetical protein CDG60_14565 [Acinetobacter chinensis]